jgi:aspartate aminotransferase
MTRYTQGAGVRALREAVAETFRAENGLDVGWQDTIVCSGGKQVIYNALAATLNEGEEVIIPAPYWVSYPEIVQLCGARSVAVPCDAEAGFKLTPQALEQALTPKTRWLILNSPSNPTGAVYTRAAFQTLAQVEPQLQARVLTMNGVSKAYAMTGWRIGFGTGPRWLLDAMEKLQGQQTSGACSISQHAAIAALRGPKDFIAISKAAFQRRRDLMVEMLNAVPGMRCEKPAGAFYDFASCEGLIGQTSAGGTLLRTDEDVAAALLDEKGIGVVQGSAFGLGPYLRIAYALDDASLRTACEAIWAFARSLS